jgi:hypothetical protein
MKIEWLPVLDVDEEIAVAVTAGIVLTVFWVLAVLFELWLEIKQAPFSLGLLTQTGAINYIKLENFLFGLLVPILSMWIFLGLTNGWIVTIAKKEGWLVTVAVILLTIPIIMMGFVGLVILMWAYGIPFYVAV